MTMRQAVHSFVRRFGVDVVSYKNGGCPPDFAPDVVDVVKRVRAYTMTSPERIAALCESVRYIARANVRGAFVECGVWRGGSAMAALSMLARAGDVERQAYLYDTFEGMPEPTGADKTLTGVDAADLLRRASKDDPDSVWCYAGLDDVRSNVRSIGYPEQNVHFVRGKVEDTIPSTVPDAIALLRLDTDWYESTKHELRHLYPRLVAGGVLIVDDYGHWQGARRAVDEYFAENGIDVLLNRIDYTGRVAVKPG